MTDKSEHNLRSIARINYKTLHETGEIRERLSEFETESEDSSQCQSECEYNPEESVSQTPEIAEISDNLARFCTIREKTSEFETESESSSQYQSECEYNPEESHSQTLGIAEISGNLAKISIPTKMSNEKVRNTLQETLRDDITDYIDENPTDCLFTVEDIDTSVGKLEDLRTKYRQIHKDIHQADAPVYEESFKEEFEETMRNIKEYITYAKKIKNNIRSEEAGLQAHEKRDQSLKEEEELLRKEKTATFLISDLDRLIEGILSDVTEQVVSDEHNFVTDDELWNKRKRIPSIQQRMDKLSDKFKNLLEVIPDTFPNKENKISLISKRYSDLVKANTAFQSKLKGEIRTRELSKEKTFEASSLKIHLPKFKGYESPLDIYTFQDKFEKLHLKQTPKRLLPELLKNNYLEGPALDFVKRFKTIDEIWVSLKKAFGDPRMMLMKKLTELEAMGPLWKTNNSEKIKNSLSKVVNVMDDLMRLAKEHDIEDKLYNGDAIYSIYKILGDVKVTKWLDRTCDDELKGNNLWKKLIEFIDKEIKIHLEKSMIYRTLHDPSSSSKDKGDTHSKSASQEKYKSHLADSISKNDQSVNAYISEKSTKKDQTTCSICGKNDHVATNGPFGKKLIQYFSCKKFAEMTPSQRFAELKRRDLCTQCLFPGASQSSGKHIEGKCQNIYACKHGSHIGSASKKHVLVCDEHRKDDANKTLLEEYRSRCIKRISNNNLPEFAKSIKLSFHSNMHSSSSIKEVHESPDENETASGIFLFQEIKVNGNTFTLFFDSGCGDLVSTCNAITKLGKNARKETDGPICIGGVGGVYVESPHGTYQVRLPLHNGRQAVMSGIVIDEVASEFPIYTLNTEVENDIREAYEKHGGNVNELPRLPESVGGQVDIMIGIKYLRYYPDEVFKMPSGLTIYLSPFINVDGSRGVVGGPHELFNAINNHYYSKEGSGQLKSFLSSQVQLYKAGYCLNPDLTYLESKCPKDNLQRLMLTLKDKHCCRGKRCTCSLVSRNQKIFNEIESAGNEITYRCVKCRDCQSCKNGERIETISTKEEVEQVVIIKSVTVDLEKNMTTASLPFIDDPTHKLQSNKYKAKAIYVNQLKKLNKDSQSKNDVITSEDKLQELGYVDYVKNLTPEQQRMIIESTIQYYIPWRAVWNGNSLSTPCRVVFDASMPTATGKSLNDVLAKGRNQMNKLVEILIRWSSKKVAFHTDVRKMYNSVKLRDSDWHFQMYLWQKDLNPEVDPEEKVIKTLIYGVKSSGNQSEYGLRQTAMLQKDEYTRAHEIVHNDVYVDDCITGEDSTDAAFQSADQLETVLSRGGYMLKGFTFSGKPPLSELSSDGKSINIAGMKWYPENDTIQLDISELNFSKKYRGKKPSVLPETKKIPDILTRKQCVAKVAEIYDITGKITPLTAAMKLDLHDLVARKLQWNDQIPDDLRGVWNSHFEMMEEINTLQYHRTVVPDDAISLQIDTIDTGDASQSIACVAIYARLKRRNGDYSCQLVFARSKLIEEGTTQPRAELIAAMLNAHTGEVVKRSFGKLHTKAIKLGDNQIVLHWINNHHKALKQWVRTRVIEICRFTERNQWHYIESKKLIADLGTRRGAKLSDVNKESPWTNGYEWMWKDESTFPVLSVNDLKLGESEKESFKKEIFSPFQDTEDLTSFEWPQSNMCFVNSVGVPTQNLAHTKILSRYKFSQYLIDPNIRKFSSVVRIIAIVIKFITNCKRNVAIKSKEHCNDNNAMYHVTCHPEESNLHVLRLTDEEVAQGRNYFFKKATEEIKRFVKKTDYERISKEKDGILYYTGRIMPDQSINTVVKMTDVMKDLTSTTFFVPLVERHSPIAYSIVNQVHWYHKVAHHAGVETILRYTMQLCYIMGGRDLVKMFRKSCERCRYLAKRTIDVAMGPVSANNLTIAPSFYITQLDIAGPFTAFSPHNKRSTIKVWFIVYCCSTTSAVNIKVMENYSTSAFLQSFIRFSCETGYPKLLVSDEGSQLVKGYGDMRINFSDIKTKLHLDMSVEFNICPIGGHNMNGKVERKIREIKQSIQKSFEKQRLSILQWETVGAEIANAINDMPLALGNIVTDFENMDLITPNRLRLGRNNERSPIGALFVTNDPSKFFAENTKIFNCWFENWLISHVPKLMNHPKWFKTEYHLKQGDIVLFLKKEGLLNETYQYGMIKSIETGRDGKIRSVIVKYRNHNENADRETRRAVRQLVMIHGVDELNIIEELGKIATMADIKKRLNNDQCKVCN